MFTFKKRTIKFNTRFVSAIGIGLGRDKYKYKHKTRRTWTMLLPFITIEAITTVFSDQPKENSYEVQ
jgi:hypothetical protein